MKLDMLFLLSASSAFVFLARDAFAIPVPDAAASHHHVKRTDNFEPVLNGILNRVDGAARGPVRLLADGDDAIHAGRSLTLAQPPHSVAQPVAQPIRPYGIQHAWNSAPYFWIGPARPHTLTHPYGEPEITVMRPQMPVGWTSIVGHDRPFALEGGRNDPGGRRGQDGAATVRGNDRGMVRQQGGENVAGPSSRPLSAIEYSHLVGNAEMVQEGERLLREALAKGQYSNDRVDAMFVSEADARLQSWLLEVFRRRIEQVKPEMQQTYRHLLWSFSDDPRKIANRSKQYKGKISRTKAKTTDTETSVAHGPFDKRHIDSPLEPFKIGPFIFHSIQHSSHNSGSGTSYSNDVDIFFSVHRDVSVRRDVSASRYNEVIIVSFGKLSVTEAPPRGNIPDALVKQ